jgi:hypothetical protein
MGEAKEPSTRAGSWRKALHPGIAHGASNPRYERINPDTGFLPWPKLHAIQRFMAASLSLICSRKKTGETQASASLDAFMLPNVLCLAHCLGNKCNSAHSGVKHSKKVPS